MELTKLINRRSLAAAISFKSPKVAALSDSYLLIQSVGPIEYALPACEFNVTDFREHQFSPKNIPSLECGLLHRTCYLVVRIEITRVGDCWYYSAHLDSIQDNYLEICRNVSA